MRGYAIRTIIAIVGFVVFMYALPLLLEVFGIGLGGAALQLIRLCCGVIALAYIVWGSYPPVSP
jgi:hypothetical protein